GTVKPLSASACNQKQSFPVGSQDQRCFDHTLKHSVYHHVRGYFQCRCKFPSSSFVPLRLILGSLTILFLSPQDRDIPIVRLSLILGVAGSHYRVTKGSLHKKWMF
ncbi:unnamed protein product, partial [Brassica oleracea]